MKKKFTRILGVSLTIALLTSLMMVAVPVSAQDPLQWNFDIFLPSSAPTVNALRAGSDVTDIAVGYDGSTIYAVSSTGNYTLKSTNGGTTWKQLNVIDGVTLATIDKPSLVAVAPDDSDLMVVVAANVTHPAEINEVFLTLNGGTTFNELTEHGLDAISCVAIAPASRGVHNIAVGGVDGGNAELAYFSLGATIPVWTSTITAPGTWGVGVGPTGDVEFKAIEFSPNFASDMVMTVVSENAALGLFEIASFNSKKWNQDGGFSGYPVTVESSPSLTAASIALAPTYLGADPAERIAFVGITDSTGTDGGLYRLEDNIVMSPTMKLDTPIYSVDYDGTNLVAGNYDQNIGYYCANPLSPVPVVTATTQYQRPGGGGEVVVAWAGENVVAGTTGDASAFAVSKDLGKTYNDVSLIDTSLTNINDYAISADGSTTYMVTDDGAYLSVWRGPGWQRVLNLDDLGYIIRAAPEDADYVYVVDTAGTGMYYSNDAGETRWMLRASAAKPVDAEVESAEVIYILTGAGMVYKSTNAGFTWDDPVDTKMGNGATIVSLSEDNLLAGGNEGGLAYSTDGGATWAEMISIFGPFFSGNVQVAASGLAAGDYIYAATSTPNQSIMRLEIGAFEPWKDASGPLTGQCSGLVLSSGVLYATSYDSTANVSYLNRSILPAFAKEGFFFSAPVSSDGEVFNKAPRALKVSAGSNKLWAIHTNTGVFPDTADALYYFIDDTYDVGPTLTSPVDEAVPETNPVTGRAGDVAFSWARLSKSTDYSLEIAIDTAFMENVVSMLFGALHLQ